MDPVTLGFYAAVCGLLGACSPLLGRLWRRLLVGALVGLVAATALPLIREALGGAYVAPGL